MVNSKPFGAPHDLLKFLTPAAEQFGWLLDTRDGHLCLTCSLHKEPVILGVQPSVYEFAKVLRHDFCQRESDAGYRADEALKFKPRD